VEPARERRLLGECFELALQFAERGLWSDLTLQSAVRGVLYGLCRVTVLDDLGPRLGRLDPYDFSKIGKCGNFLRMSGSEYKARLTWA
jgi:hypothetical protein